MKPNDTLLLEEIAWENVREEVHKVNPFLTELIDEFCTHSQLPLYRGRYPFGATIVKDGIFYLPTSKGTVLPLNDDSIPQSMQENVGYNNGIPLGIVLRNSAELFMCPKARTIPFSIMQPGKLFGLWRALSSSLSYLAPQVWHMVAGARNIFFLPRITDTPSYKKLARARGIKQPMPRNLLDQWPMLTQLASHPNFSHKWYTDMLFFPFSWLNIKDGARLNSLPFHHYLLQEAWKSAEHWRNKVIYDFIWDSFIKEIINEHNIKASPHLIDIVKHLILVGLGALPGFSPALDNQSAPIDGFKEDLVSIYDLKKFAPTIMVPHHFSLEEDKPVYVSLQLPTYFESAPRPRTPNSVMEELREIRMLINAFHYAVTEGTLKTVVGQPISEFFSKVNYEFFHSEHDPDQTIKHSKLMVAEDESLIKCSLNYGQRTFSEISPFVRGCIRISLKKN